MLMLAFITAVASPAYSAITADTVQPDVKLTETQKQELETLYKDILTKKKKVIQKYVEYDVMSEEKGKKITSQMEKRYQKLAQNGFIPQWEKPKHKAKK